MDSWITWSVGISVAYLIGHFIGGHVRAYQIMQNLIKNPDGMIELIGKLKTINDAEIVESTTIPDDAIIVDVQHANDQVYCYDKLTGEFLAQAGNLHQAIVLAAKRFPGKKFWHPELKQDSQIA